MTVFKPFKAFRPHPLYAHQVVALPYDVYSTEEAREITKRNPHSFLRVDKSEVDLEPTVSPYDEQVYLKAQETLEKLFKNRILVQDIEPCFYIYQLTMNDWVQTGIVGVTTVDDYVNEIIKKHEHTREDKEADRIRHIDTCNAQTGVIFSTFSDDVGIRGILQEWMENHAPVYQFKTDDQVRHGIWRIAEPEIVEEISARFHDVGQVYIADGHHRAASAAKVGLMRRAAEDGDMDAPYNYFISALFPHDQLHILDYNRVVKDLNGLEVEQFLVAISEKFIVEAANLPVKPTEKGSFGMYVEGQWYSLTLRDAFVSEDPIEGLDVAVLQDHILSPILGIGDPRVDKRIDFVGGIRGLGELVKKVDSGEWKVAFSMYPTAIEEVMRVADAGKVMPPKSTWFEPKLRSGFFIHRLEE